MAFLQAGRPGAEHCLLPWASCSLEGAGLYLPLGLSLAVRDGLEQLRESEKGLETGEKEVAAHFLQESHVPL